MGQQMSLFKNSKSAIKHIESEIDRGVFHFEIYQDLQDKVQSKKDLITNLSQCASLNTKTKFKPINLILWFFLLASFLVQSTQAIKIFSNFSPDFMPWLLLQGWVTHVFIPLLSFYFLFILHKFRENTYRMISIYSFLVISFNLFTYNDPINWLIYMAPWLSSLITSIVILKKGFPCMRLIRGVDHQKFEELMLLGNPNTENA